MSKKQRIILIVGIIFAVLLVAGGSYAFWMWSSNVNKNVAFNTAELEKYIVYNEGDAKFIGNFQPVSSFCESAHNTLSFYKKIELQDMNVTASIKMQVNSIGENIALSNDVHWVVTTGDKDIDCSGGLTSESVLASGTFNGVTNGQILELHNNIVVTLDEQFYTVWIWIDSNGSNLSTLSGETIDTNIWTDFELLGKKEYVVTFDANGGNFFENTYDTPGQYIYDVPLTGEYRFEVWGAQGGNVKGGTNGGTISSIKPGYGGYSKGEITLSMYDKLYVNVGGKGTDNCVSSSNGTVVTCSGGYNGGGNGASTDAYGYISGGGGATHIATKSGLLSSLSNSRDSILIVAGGGGGSAYYNYDNKGWKGSGGSGGGMNGNSSTFNSSTPNTGEGGTQTTGNSFGQGKNANLSSGSITFNSGGGGGYYGGKSVAGGGGGSGYIGNNLLFNKEMYCYNCDTSDDESTLTYSTTNVSGKNISNYAKSGNGAAKISFLSMTMYVEPGFSYNDLPIPTRRGYIFLGWNTAEDGSGTMVTEDSIVSINDDHTLYALWEPVETLYLYNSGTENTNVTGGFGQVNHPSDWYNTGTFTKNSSYINLRASSSDEGSANTIFTKNLVDINNYNKLYINVTSFSNNASISYASIRLYSQRSIQTGDPYVIANAEINKTGLFSINLPPYNGSYYIAVGVICEYGTLSLSFDEIYLE